MAEWFFFLANIHVVGLGNSSPNVIIKAADTLLGIQNGTVILDALAADPSVLSLCVGSDDEYKLALGRSA